MTGVLRRLARQHLVHTPQPLVIDSIGDLLATVWNPPTGRVLVEPKLAAFVRTILAKGSPTGGTS